MALKRNERYPGRFENPTTAQPQGAFKNRTSPTSQDGSYLEADWVNDWSGFFGRLLTVAGITPNGNADTALASQYYDALKALFLQRTNPFGDIKTDGTVNTALSNLGLGEAAKRDVGTGNNQLPDMSSFPLTVTGDLSSRKLTTKLPNGLILKAVNGNADSNGWFSLNFDTPFPSEILFCWAVDRLPVSAQNQLSVINANINLSAVDHVAGYARAITIGGGVGPVAASISVYALGR